MNVTWLKPEDETLLKFIVDISDEEYSKYEKFGHELKCFMLFAENRLKDSNEFIYYNSYYEKDEIRNYSKIFLEYFNRKNHALALHFEISLYHQQNLIFDHITLLHRNSLTFIDETTTEFRNIVCLHIQELVEQLLNRNTQGSFCLKCVYRVKQKFVNKCDSIYNELKE